MYVVPCRRCEREDMVQMVVCAWLGETRVSRLDRVDFWLLPKNYVSPCNMLCWCLQLQNLRRGTPVRVPRREYARLKFAAIGEQASLFRVVSNEHCCCAARGARHLLIKQHQCVRRSAVEPCFYLHAQTNARLDSGPKIAWSTTAQNSRFHARRRPIVRYTTLHTQNLLRSLAAPFSTRVPLTALALETSFRSSSSP